MRVDIGIGLPNPVRGVDGVSLLEWARRADRAGFSTLATIDRIAFPSYESMVTLAAAAGATERIRLFTNILLGPTRDPVVLAKEAASLDQLSGGRFRLGIGVGGRQDDFTATGRASRDRGRRLDADLELMHRIWRGEAVAGSPEPLAPRPVDGRAVPLIVGGASDRTVERSLRYGIGWTASGAPPEQVGPFADRVRQAWREAGKGEPLICALSYFSVGDEETSREYLRDYYAFTGQWVDRIADSAARTPDAIRERIEAFRAIGVDELILDPTVADPDQVDRLAEIVL
jgi:alkanesulfonate monooxygenase SsuD/methylene tetrahydromethanopterin reductase-like flavin-dependent oxidoreductase (luciferase family)